MFKAVAFAVAGASAVSSVAADCSFGRSTQLTTTITFKGLDDANDVSGEQLKALCGIIANQAALTAGADDVPECEHAVGGVPVKVTTVLKLPHVMNKAELISDVESFVALEIENEAELAELSEGGTVHVSADDVSSICTMQDSRKLAEAPTSWYPGYLGPNHPNDGDEGNEGNEGTDSTDGGQGTDGAKYPGYLGPNHPNDGDEGNEGNEGTDSTPPPSGKYPGYLGPNHPNDGDEGNEGNEGKAGKAPPSGKYPGYLGPNHPNDGDEGNEGNEGKSGKEGKEGEGKSGKYPGYLGPNHPNDGDEGNEGNEGGRPY